MFKIKLYINAGKASATPPIGPILGQYRLNLIEFCKDFNLQTSDWDDSVILPVTIFGYSEGDFEYVIKMPTTSFLLKKIVCLEACSTMPGHLYLGILTVWQLYEIATIKWLLDSPLYNKLVILCSTAASMGIYITE